MIKNKKNITLFDQLLSTVPSEVKRFVRKQGEIAIQIGTILKAKGISQKELAQKIGMRESQLSKILTGNANCTLKTITKIEHALNEDIITVPIFIEDFTRRVVIDASSESFKGILSDDKGYSIKSKVPDMAVEECDRF